MDDAHAIGADATLLTPQQINSVLGSWSRLLLIGSPTGIDATLTGINSGLREHGWESQPNRGATARASTDQEVDWIRYEDRSGRAEKVTLAFVRLTSRRVRTNLASHVTADPLPSLLDLAQAIEIAFGVVKAVVANQAGVKMTFPKLGPLSRAPTGTATALRDLGDFADGAWPLDPKGERAWRKFVVTARREDAAFDLEEMLLWCRESGWKASDAKKLVAAFQRDFELISDYQDAVNP